VSGDDSELHGIWPLSGPLAEPVRIPLADTPEECGNCGYGRLMAQWPLCVYGGRLNITCPNCHLIVAEVVAVPAN